MRRDGLVSVVAAAWLMATASALPARDAQQALARIADDRPRRPLQGRFLHITGEIDGAWRAFWQHTRQGNRRLTRQTDFHPDEFYQPHTSTENICHRGEGHAGIYGAETTECDSPHTLANATFDWIAANIADKVDFVIWTGDSARHDGDENHPRNTQGVLAANRYIADRFVDAFSDDEGRLHVPIVPTFGNNDFLPHNIMTAGPNKWLVAYTDVWRRFIPEEQRHSFEFGGWFYVEVIPGKLAVFSLNTMFFFDRNAAVDGCAEPSEPGFKHMEWLRVQLQLLRGRGMKAILMGHVPPARTASKQLWDETCWQVYTLWLRQFRDVVVGSLYGHMNIDHFLLADSKNVNIDSVETESSLGDGKKKVSTTGKKDYLDELRSIWADLPRAAGKIKDLYDTDALYDDGDDDEAYGMHDDDDEDIESEGVDAMKKKRRHKWRKIGGKHAERYQISLVSPSVVPNYLPTLRIIEYNITGIEDAETWEDPFQLSDGEPDLGNDDARLELRSVSASTEDEDELAAIAGKKKKGKKGKDKKPKDPNLVIPDDPRKKDLPGPAYSPQTLSFTSLQQYFVNLTHVNNEPSGGKGKGKDKDKIKTREFTFELEYDTRTDKDYGMHDLTVRSWVELAYRMGKGAPAAADMSDVDTMKKKGKGKGKGKKDNKDKKSNKTWLAFAQRAFVSTVSREELDS